MLESFAQEILAKLRAAQKIVLALHCNPDADSLGSAAALAEFLKAQGLAFQYYCATALPSQAALFGIAPDKILTPAELSVFASAVICVFDAGDLAHAGLHALKSWPFIINFDHHATNTRFGAINAVDTTCASTTEVVYGFLNALRAMVSPRLARYLLAGLLTDTDHFMNPATSASALIMAARLLSQGVGLNALRQILFEQRGIADLQLIGEALARLQNTRYGLAFTYLTEEDALRHGVKLEQAADLANILNVVNDARAMMVIKHEAGVVKVSMRTTRSDVDLSRLAEALGGGGHPKAAGFRFRGTLQIKGDCVRVL